MVKRGIRTVAFGRSRQKLEQLKTKLGQPEHLTIAVGDAFRPEDIVSAAEDAEVLFHAANVPYHEMANKLIPLGESVMEAAERLGLKVVASMVSILMGEAGWPEQPKSIRSSRIRKRVRPDLPSKKCCLTAGGKEPKC
ncbi:hypothetical protein HMSSN036_22410 [Paenibacillus macerans]|nr:hypothetical protein HMSSN036_22410 [Paenibacillus macerans]